MTDEATHGRNDNAIRDEACESLFLSNANLPPSRRRRSLLTWLKRNGTTSDAAGQHLLLSLPLLLDSL